MDRDELLSSIPDIPSFATLEDLGRRVRSLLQRYPEVIGTVTLGFSRLRRPLRALRIGEGHHTVIILGFLHPHEPIGGISSLYLAEQLASHASLRRSRDVTWYIIPYADPDGAHQNERWFRRPFRPIDYARHVYCPPYHQNIEWTFPVRYDSLSFTRPLPETKALLALIERVHPDLIISLQSTLFGGIAFHLSQPVHELYHPLRAAVADSGLPLHSGEHGLPFAQPLNQGIYRMATAATIYQYYRTYGDEDPARVWQAGTSLADIAQSIADTLSLAISVPLYQEPQAGGEGKTTTLRREAILDNVTARRRAYEFVREHYETVEGYLRVPSPLRDVLADYVRTTPMVLAAQEAWARRSQETERSATVAEIFDNYQMTRLERLIILSTFNRLLQTELSLRSNGVSKILLRTSQRMTAEFDQWAVILNADLHPALLPIATLVRAQMAATLAVVDFISTLPPRREGGFHD